MTWIKIYSNDGELLSRVAVEYSFLSISWSENCRLALHVHLLIYGIEKIIRMENVKCMYVHKSFP